MGCHNCAKKRVNTTLLRASAPTHTITDVGHIEDGVVVVELPPDNTPSERILPGVIDLIAPSRGTHDAAGMGDSFLIGSVAQALQKKYPDFSVRIITLENVRDWAALASNGMQTDDINNTRRKLGERAAYSSALNTYRVDEACLAGGINRHQFYAQQFDVSYDEVKKWSVKVDGRAIEKMNTWLRPALDELRPIVAISPFATKFTRTWPLRKWLNLIIRLQERNFAVYVLDHPRMANDPSPAHHLMAKLLASPNVHEVAAVVMQSDLLIAGDTGTAHLAGWTRTPALALCGPTNGNIVFGGWDTVEHIQAPCIEEAPGCTWSQKRGWRTWCALGCDALESLSVEAVEQRAIEMLAKRREL